MRITISGYPGAGKSSVAELLAEKLGYKHYSVGEFMRSIAKKKGLNLLELSKKAELDREIDDELDRMQKALNKEDNFVIDSRLGYYFIRGSVKIFLDVNGKTAARRIYNDMGRQERENTSLAETANNIKRRVQSEKARYLKYYGTDPYDKKNYDMVIDTTNLTVEQVVGRVTNFIKGRQNRLHE